jgi:hypothetical protein
MILINDKIKALDPYYYISKWEYYEDRTDQLAVIADALANALEETKAKLQELIQGGDLNETDGCPLRRVCRLEG